jgi:L-ascorbate oxidase
MMQSHRHIHGGHVWDLGSGEGNYDSAANEQKLAGFTPAKRDTTFLYKYVDSDGIGTLTPYKTYGWRAWRLRVDDAGVWMVHCHILQHMVMGMQTVWVMGDEVDITKKQEPYVKGYLEYGGSAYGSKGVDPLVNHYFEN